MSAILAIFSGIRAQLALAAGAAAAVVFPLWLRSRRKDRERREQRAADLAITKHRLNEEERTDEIEARAIRARRDAVREFDARRMRRAEGDPDSGSGS
jgi:hypothetical protein